MAESGGGPRGIKHSPSDCAGKKKLFYTQRAQGQKDNAAHKLHCLSTVRHFSIKMKFRYSYGQALQLARASGKTLWMEPTSVL